MTDNELEVTVEDLEAFADAWDRHDVDTIMSFFTDECDSRRWLCLWRGQVQNDG